MTDEEMAEEYADNISGLELTCSLLSAKDKNHAYRFGRYDGFLAGLKAGRPQWHDLRKDPNDLPESYHTSIINQDGEKVMYDYSCKAWRYDDADEYLCDTPIAWCESPTFDKE